MRRLLLPMLAAVVALVSACTLTWSAGDGSSGQLNCPNAPTAVPTAAVSGTCTWSVTPAPKTSTTTVPPTTTTVPPTTTTTTAPPPPGGFPSPATTGVPAGTVLTNHAATTITTPNLVISGWHVTGDLLVNAPGVKIVDSQVDGYLDNESTVGGSTPMQVTDSTIGADTGCNDLPGVGEHDYVATRVLIHNHGDGFRVSGSNVSIKDSFVQDCDSVNNHDDGMQAYCPGFVCSNVVIDHNTLSVANTQNYTAPVFGGVGPSTNGSIANVSITNNLLWGGVFTIYVQWSQGPNFTITGNRLVNSSWTYASSSLEGTCSHVTWSDNRAVSINTSTFQPNADAGALSCLN